MKKAIIIVAYWLAAIILTAFLLTSLDYGYYLLARWLERKYPSDRPVTFTSDYRKVSVRTVLSGPQA